VFHLTTRVRWLGGMDSGHGVAGVAEGLAHLTDPEGRHDFEEADNDQPNPGDESQYDDRIERPREHDDTGDDADDPNEDRPIPSGNAR